MRRLMTAVVLALGVGLVACSSDDTLPAAEGLETRSVSAGDVEVTITPTRVDGTGATFEVAFDTHTVELDLDIARQATLTVDGQPWPDPSWDGTRPGGHHREGTLTFSAAGPADGDAVLTIEGLEEPVNARWALPEGT